MDHRPKCKTKTTKVPEESIEENLYDYEFSNDLLDRDKKNKP